MTRILAALALLVAVALPARAAIEITPVTSEGGITAWLYADDTIPILTIEASVRGGASLDPEGQEGVVRLMTALLEEGAGDLDATAFAEAREALAARFGFDAGRDSVAISAEMLSENRDATVDLLRLALTAPRFDETAVDRVRAQALSGLRSDETDPRTLAGRAFYAAAFPGHPYARPVDGTLESVAALSVDDLRAAHAQALTRDRLMISVVGDITADELGPLLDRLFGELPATGPDLPPVAEPVTSGTTTVIDLDIPQSVVTFGHGGLMRDDPDFIPAFVLDHILGGGGFGSRLTEELREKRGLTYGIYTYLAPGDFGALYMGSFSTVNARAGEALDLVRAEWARLAAEGVTEAELADAKRYLTGAYPLRFDGNSRIAGQLIGLQTAGLDIDYVNIRNDLVEAVTREDIARVAARLLRPEALTTVIVGRPRACPPGTDRGKLIVARIAAPMLDLGA
jgi:zinc protease